MKTITALIFLTTIVIYAQHVDVESVNYAKLKPMLNKKGNKTYVVNFWATWCAPCIKELPYFEELNKKADVEVLLVSLDFIKYKEKRLLPFIKKRNIRSKIVLLDDPNENYWINEISKNWSGALPATIIYTKNRKKFYEKSFKEDELFKLVENFKL